MVEAGTKRTGPGRRPKFEPDEVKRRLIEASIAEVLEQGVSYGVNVRLDRVLVLADVPRGSAYSLWDDSELAPQDALRRETVLSLLRDMPSGNADATRTSALETIATLGDRITSTDLDDRRAARNVVVHAVAEFNHSRLNSQQWRVYQALTSAAITVSPPDQEILDAIATGDENLLVSYESLFGDFAELFAMTLRPGVTLRQFVMCIYALNQGMANKIADSYDRSVDSFAIGCEALLDRFYEFN